MSVSDSALSRAISSASCISRRVADAAASPAISRARDSARTDSCIARSSNSATSLASAASDASRSTRVAFSVYSLRRTSASARSASTSAASFASLALLSATAAATDADSVASLALADICSRRNSPSASILNRDSASSLFAHSRSLSRTRVRNASISFCSVSSCARPRVRSSRVVICVDRSSFSKWRRASASFLARVCSALSSSDAAAALDRHSRTAAVDAPGGAR